MRKRLAMLLFSLLLPFLVMGQTTPAPSTPPTQHFVISANAAGYGGPGSGTQAVMIVGAGFQLTSNISVSYGSISNPTDSTQPRYNLGDFNYTREVASFLPASLKAKLTFDTTNYLVTFQASGGKVTAPGVNRVAEGAGIYISRPVANNMQLTCGYRFLHGVGTSTVKIPSVGINFTF
jgi:hypothetical protein